jgi:hypothetical protein
MECVWPRMSDTAAMVISTRLEKADKHKDRAHSKPPAEIGGQDQVGAPTRPRGMGQVMDPWPNASTLAICPDKCKGGRALLRVCADARRGAYCRRSVLV